ncbi:MAG: PhnI protein [Candidatus Carbobacillus altaicus]|uniref:PhnI protein n=1 Tax=Candidatus Carbonibacillus altaicus TaxID=2163959 RepID=A0A2R6Y2D5_9BACL|nr:MAG: PhnI protein [Candidatus Carbobacillus altaicus]
MGYVATIGGEIAIEEALKRLTYERLKDERSLATQDMIAGMPRLIDIIMSEASLYDRPLAAIALKQAQGLPEEAVFLLRAYRSTLPRLATTQPLQPSSMTTIRRISASFKEIPGGQFLGGTPDYTHRLLDQKLAEETHADAQKFVAAYRAQCEEGFDPTHDRIDTNPLIFPEKVHAMLPSIQAVKKVGSPRNAFIDLTREPPKFPLPRSGRLQLLTRGQTGAVIAFAYALQRSFGELHPTVGELRVGQLTLTVPSPWPDETEGDDAYTIGDILVTEVETFFPTANLHGSGEKEHALAIGYGFCFGQNESKAIAMSMLDFALRHPHPEYPSTQEEFVLYHIDTLEASGFIAHLKLPHYVTFASLIDTLSKGEEKGHDA